MRSFARLTLLSASLLAVSAPAQGAMIVFNLDGFITGAAPTSPLPWLTLTFEDVGLGAVQLTVKSDLEVTSEFISEVVFNVDPSIDPTAVLFAFNPFLSVGSFTVVDIAR